MNKIQISFIFIIVFFVICASASLCFAGAKKPPQPEEAEEKGYIDWESFDAKMEDPAEFYARPEDLNDDGIIDERDRMLWFRQKRDEMVIE